MRYMLALLSAIFLSFAQPAHAGQIEVDGVWYTADEARRFVGKQARLLVIPGSFFGNNNKHLWERFWGSSDFRLELKEVYGAFRGSYETTLRESPDSNTAISVVVITDYQKNLGDIAFVIFGFLAAMGDGVMGNTLLSCLEIRGTLDIDKNNVPGSISTVKFKPGSGQMFLGVEKIPFSWDSSVPPQITTEEATARCTSPQR